MSLTEAADSGDRVAALRELRSVLAHAIETCESARDLAALTGRMQAVLAEIADLAPPEVKGNPLDELNRKRVARGSAPARAAGSKVGR